MFRGHDDSVDKVCSSDLYEYLTKKNLVFFSSCLSRTQIFWP